jgi:hypothetical protein
MKNGSMFKLKKMRASFWVAALELDVKFEHLEMGHVVVSTQVSSEAPFYLFEEGTMA